MHLVDRWPPRFSRSNPEFEFLRYWEQRNYTQQVLSLLTWKSEKDNRCEVLRSGKLRHRSSVFHDPLQEKKGILVYDREHHGVPKDELQLHGEGQQDLK